MKRELIFTLSVCLIFAVLVIVVSTLAFAGSHINSEKYYQQKWCMEHNGQVEVVLPDKTRCDCITATNAIEFDFGEKWAESIGQALYYSIQTGKKAGVVLILEKPKDNKYWIRLNTIIQYYKLPIDTWKIE